MATSRLAPPALGWLHLGAEETRRAREVLRRLEHSDDTVDELGFGVFRNGFANQFFPGTNTVMTEVRYLFFIAALYRWIERSLEERASAVPDPLRASREMQDQLRDRLRESYGNSTGHGIIGIRAEHPVRYPSDIYWSSLRQLDFFRLSHDGEADYQRRLVHHHERTRGQAEAEATVEDDTSENWDPHAPYHQKCHDLIDDRGKFVRGLRFELTRDEAAYLRDCYVGSIERPDAPLAGSLLAHLISLKKKVSFSYPWEAPSPPAPLRQPLDDAMRFSALARGATLQYYFWLHRRREERKPPASEADFPALFAIWWKAARPLLSADAFALEGFLERQRASMRAGRRDREFLTGWLAGLRSSGSAATFLSDQATRSLIVAREQHCKPRKARLTFDAYLERGDCEPAANDSPFHLDYRTPIGAKFVNAIVDGLRRGTT